jgi:hypothetical protein
VTHIWPSARLAILHARHTAKAPLVWDPAGHALSRFNFGPSTSTRASFTKRGPDVWFANEIAAGRRLSGYRGSPGVAAQGPLLTKDPAYVRAWLKARGNEYGWDAMDQLTRVTLGLQTWSQAQLYETVVDFFANHLNVANHSGVVWSTRHTMDRDVIRGHAFGSYTDMLLASARNPAMLQFLNLAQSKKSAINENYGRELLELHTVGRVYSENDVKFSARILTGRTLDDDFNYYFRPDRHWTGPVRVLGFLHANAAATGGEAVGDAYLRYLASHPSTAKLLATKLCVRFVSDAPSAALIAAVARSYLVGKTQIVPMLATIFRSDEFWSSRGLKVRRPAENLIATIRALGVRPAKLADTLNSLHWMTSSVGNVPLDWAAPNGYPDVAAAWRSSGSLLNLWGFHRGLTQNWYDGFAKLNTQALYGTAKTSGAVIDALTKRLTGSAFPAAHRQALQSFLAEPASTPLAQSQLRWYLDHLIPLILDAPQHALR